MRWRDRFGDRPKAKQGSEQSSLKQPLAGAELIEENAGPERRPGSALAEAELIEETAGPEQRSGSALTGARSRGQGGPAQSAPLYNDRRYFLKEAAVMTLASALPSSAMGADKPSATNRLKARIPSSGEELLRVGLGTYKTFDVQKDAAGRKALTSVLSAFVEGGGTLVDSSPMYGSAEEVVGDLSAELRLNEKLFLATKVWISGKEAGIRQMNESFDKLKRQKLELMQIHNLLDWKLHLPALRKWKEEGRIRYLGITHYTPSAFDEMERVLEKEPMDFIQIPYSLGETAGEKRLIPLAAEKGVAVIANEPFGAGALFRQVKGKQVPGWAKEMGMASWAQYFLKFILSSKDVQFAIPATRRVEHCKDNLAAATGPLPSAEQRERMRREFVSL